jgi:transposase-like protein
MKYTRRIKESVLRKVLPPESRSVLEVAKEMGISEQTMYNWKSQAQMGKLSIDDQESPLSTSRLERFNLLLEGKGLREEDYGKWLREKGLRSEHLNLWEQEFKDMLKDKENKLRLENQQLKKEKKELERELRRKEKALAEVAALLTLKKKRMLSGGKERTNDSREQ